MRLHVPAMPHSELVREMDWCAYTAKIRRLPEMLAARGHEVITYGDATCDVDVIGVEDRRRWFGADRWDRDRLFDRWDPNDPCWVETNRRAAFAILERFEPGDALGLIMGRAQESIVGLLAAEYPNPLTLEWGVGYEGILHHSQCAFESAAWRNHVYGLRGWRHGRAFDAVIPNAFDPDDYLTAPSDGYLLFLGRHVETKGLAVVRAIAARGHHVVTAGQCGPCDNLQWEGIVTGDAKAKLLAGARALLVPTLYVEPFGGVAVEAMMSGVPVICSDWGAFPETVRHGVDGFRCSVLQDFLDAVDDLDSLDRGDIARHARNRFATKTVGYAYDEWIRRCDLLHRSGWPEVRD